MPHFRDVAFPKIGALCGIYPLSATDLGSPEELWLRRSCPRCRLHRLPEAGVPGGLDDVPDRTHRVGAVEDLMTRGHFCERPLWPLRRQIPHDRFVDAIG